jgi:hypothetical protein
MALSLAALLAGCNGPPTLSVQGDCLTDSQCDAGYVCDDNYRCVPGPGFDGDLFDGDVPDGDRVDGDNSIDGDSLPDGDVLPDGDFVPDGDVSWPYARLTLFEIRPTPPTSAGTSLRLIADGESSNGVDPLYRFMFRIGAGEWQSLSDWRVSSVFDFTPEFPGVYTIRVDIRHPDTQNPRGFDDQLSRQHQVTPGADGDVIDGDNIDGDIAWPVARLLDFRVTPPSPTHAGDRLTLTAIAEGENGLPVLYRFFSRQQGGSWQALGEFAPGSSASVRPTQPGQYQFRVQVRSVASEDPRGFDDQLSRQHSVLPAEDGDVIDGDEGPMAEVISFRVQPSGPVYQDITVFFNTRAVSPNQVQYRYDIYHSQTGWRMVQDYPGSPIFQYAFRDPDPVGTWVVRVQVRDIFSSNQDYDDQASVAVVVLDNNGETYSCATACQNLADCGYLFPGSPVGDNLEQCLGICADYGLSDGELACLSVSSCNEVYYCLNNTDGDVVDGDVSVYSCDSACMNLEACGYLMPGSPFGTNLDECVRLCEAQNYDPWTLECASTKLCNQLMDCMNPPDGDAIDGDQEVCDDGNPCTDDYLSSDGRCAHYPMPDGVDCSDGNRCVQFAYCFQGSCYEQPIACNDNNPCTNDTCNEQFGCVYTPTSNRPCSDGLACTANDLCLSGRCVGAAVDCQSDNPCTVGQCREPNGCVFTPRPNNTACNDDDPCTGPDYCMSGQCIGNPPGPCDDNNPCTEEYYNEDTCACQSRPLDGLACDDNNLCTQNDVCRNGSCAAGTPVTCPSSDPCRVGVCDPANGGCRYQNASNGTVCNDSNLCTTGDQCISGVCRGSQLPCNDYNDCTLNRCDAATGQCSYPPDDGASCDDHLVCTSSGVCFGGDCLPGQGITCAVDNPCAVGRCVEPLGCEEDLLPDGTPCATPAYDGFCRQGSCELDPVDGDTDTEYTCFSACVNMDDCGFLMPGSPFGSSLDECVAVCADLDFDLNALTCASTAACGDIYACFDVTDGDVIDGDVIDDRDNDGVTDDSDNCPDNFNPSQSNQDTDPLGDACDNCVYQTNSDQADDDSDGLGSACDPTPYTPYACVSVTCSSSNTCVRFGLTCGSGSFCTTSCTSNSQCPAPWTCDRTAGLCRCPENSTCPQTCSANSQCPADLPICADVYGGDGVKECSRACSASSACPSGYRCDNDVCVCDSLPPDSCTQAACNSNTECRDAGWGLCTEVPWEPRAICTTACDSAADCPFQSECVEGYCVCGDPGPATCNYGSCFTDQNCWSSYSSNTYCVGPWWPLFQRYCTANCQSNIDCIAVFGADFYCNASKECACRD